MKEWMRIKERSLWKKRERCLWWRISSSELRCVTCPRRDKMDDETHEHGERMTSAQTDTHEAVCGRFIGWWVMTDTYSNNTDWEEMDMTTGRKQQRGLIHPLYTWFQSIKSCLTSESCSWLGEEEGGRSFSLRLPFLPACFRADSASNWPWKCKNGSLYSGYFVPCSYNEEVAKPCPSLFMSVSYMLYKLAATPAQRFTDGGQLIFLESLY